MATVIGPSTYLPGALTPFKPDGRRCDECDAVATVAYVGETDSEGSEIHHLCNVHYAAAELHRQAQAENEHYCESCRQMKPDCAPRRDPTEGPHGPVRLMCPSCYETVINAFLGEDPDPLSEIDLEEAMELDDVLDDELDDD